MRWRVILVVSLSVNVALAFAWILSDRRLAAVDSGPASATGQRLAATNQIKTNVVVRRQFFSWREVESPHYPTYIANLRDIGCPEATIRDIIIADVNQLYARKRATDVTTTNQQWWRSEPDTNVTQAATEKLQALEEDRQALLTRLLGPNWEIAEVAAVRPRVNVTLDGPVLGLLPDEVKQALQDITARSAERTQAYVNAQRSAGKTPDLAELARLRQQTRDELAQVLTPPQVEEFLLRHSQNASTLRNDLGELRYFDASAEEFRNIFRATDLIDQQIQLLAGSTDPNSVAQLKILEQQREAAIKNALGPERYEEYRRLHDPAYRQAVATAQQSGAPDQTVDAFYQINQAVALEQARVRADTNLTEEQRAIELKRIELEQLKANAQLLGQELPPEPPLPPGFRSANTIHVVTLGETLPQIAAATGYSIREILDANPDLKDFLKVTNGYPLILPQPKAQP